MILMVPDLQMSIKHKYTKWYTENKTKYFVVIESVIPSVVLLTSVLLFCESLCTFQPRH